MPVRLLDVEAVVRAFNPPPPDAFTPLGYEPTEKQRLFHAATEFDVLYGGAAGGGKTKALLMQGLQDCVQYPGIRIGAFRRSYPELEESLLAELAEVGFAQTLGAAWNGTKHQLQFANGSLLMFRYAESVKDATRRQGGQYQRLLFDERTLTNPDVIRYLEHRLRSGRASIPVLGVRSGSNPGGVGHGAAKTRFIDPTEYGNKTYLDKRGRTVRFIPSRLDDNPHVNPEYADDLNELPEAMRKAFRDGNWDIFAGMMFPELDRARYVLEPITLPETWRRYAGVDWGYAKPWAVVWGALDEDGRLWIYRELYSAGVGEAEQARRIRAAEGGLPAVTARYADDAMWASRGDAKPISDVYADQGVHLTQAGKGPRSRVTGWQRIRSFAGLAPACPHHRAQRWELCPKLHIFTTCTELWRELTTLPHATTGDPEDADTNASDHAADALRYLAINIGSEPAFVFGNHKPAEPKVAPDQTYVVHPEAPSGPGFVFGRGGGSPWG